MHTMIDQMQKCSGWIGANVTILKAQYSNENIVNIRNTICK